MKRLTRDPNELIPLKQSTYQILLALEDGQSLHGYAIMQAVNAMTDGRETILPGTLYAALARMVDEGLVAESEPRPDDASGGPSRRYYQRTTFGRAVARAESERLRALLDVARAQNIFGARK
ncbi:MAG TPA: PadR family transcriptional regulator [Vicinamibacterales bacterium]|nr:PadR family transcriptional regulator [Vicinamibacterales bacterium]